MRTVLIPTVETRKFAALSPPMIASQLRYVYH